ncbi:hypothetical protein PsAD46_03350 [Pseudovibrio sp. Ad46]|uniref:hypothetical protein n=1 Tax=unclassified Pseudovibrio TaxID=2627060 RepID=UPI0007AED825|nr:MULTISPECIES: hypothetical protein [unclassified Pseudovibrio]KZK85759.1 hypothetical protein PsAD46_03350 [Pseudovibrio sp. Ad46]KZK97926.1 hypothetical protein PsAD5_02165 [Pseudovibrio sp. Ad5]
MPPVTLEFADDNHVHFRNAVERIGNRKTAERAYRKVINKTGTKLRKGVLKTLPKQTGLPSRTIRKALGKPKRASASYKGNAASLSYVLTTKGGLISLKHFKPRELMRGGVVARPRGQRLYLEKAFMKGGRFPGRKTLNLGGAVFRANLNVGKRWYRGFHSLKSSVRIPDEMVIGPSKAEHDNATRSFAPAMEVEIKRLLAVKG